MNAAQSDSVYSMKFVSPESYDAFFQAVRDGNATTYESALQARLLE